MSVAFKLAIARFINTAIVPTVVNASVTDWFTSAGLVSDYFTIMVGVAFTTPILYVLDVTVLITRYK